ncbi:MAG TPA: hypothetical protein VEI07_24430 [Planctomycetaceae bacterium]|nr:hypothetical protein [Planctomycetaceae bacterium]
MTDKPNGRRLTGAGLAKRCFLVCLIVAAVCGFIATFAWYAVQPQPAYTETAAFLFILSYFLALVGGISSLLAFAFLAIWVIIRRR